MAFSHKSMALGELSGRFLKSNFLSKVRKSGFIFLGKCGNDVIRIKSYDSGLKEIAFHDRKLLRVFHHWTPFLLWLWNHISFLYIIFPLLLWYVANRIYFLFFKRRKMRNKKIKWPTRRFFPGSPSVPFKKAIGFFFFFFHTTFTNIDFGYIEQKNLYGRKKSKWWVITCSRKHSCCNDQCLAYWQRGGKDRHR